MGYVKNPTSHHYAEQKKIKFIEFDTKKEMANKQEQAILKSRRESQSPTGSMDPTASGYTSNQDKQQ